MHAIIAKPRWDAKRRQLWIGSSLVKTFHRLARCQELILRAFHQEHWPWRIDSPLPRRTMHAQQALRNAVRKLNKQSILQIRFHADGTGQGITWEPAEKRLRYRTSIKRAAKRRPPKPHIQVDGRPAVVAGPPLPVWDPETRVLRLSGGVVKRFRQAAQNQQAILAAFQEEGWPPYIDSPISGNADCSGQERLHNAVKRLNRGMKGLLRFECNGMSTGVLWRLGRRK